MATLQSGKCFTVPTFFGMCCRSEWQERMYIYKWHEVDQTKHEIFCSYCLQWNTSQSKFRNHYFLFLFAFSILSQLFSDLGLYIKIKYSEPNMSAAASVSPLAFAVLLLAVIKQRCIAVAPPSGLGVNYVFVVRHHAPNRDACTVTVRYEYMYRATPNIYIYIYIYIHTYFGVSSAHQA